MFTHQKRYRPQAKYKKRRPFIIPWYICAVFTCILVLSVAIPLLVGSNVNPLRAEQIHMLNLGADDMLNAGDVIVITFRFTNEGDAVIRNIEITNSLGLSTSCGNDTITELLPQQTQDCVTVYVLTQEDINIGVFSLEMEVYSSLSPGIATSIVTNTSTAQTTFGQLTVTQSHTLDLGTDEMLSEGDIIQVDTKVMNSGTETILGIILDGGAESMGSIVVGILLPMQMEMYSYNYSITISDILSEMYSTSATATGTGTTSALMVSDFFNATTNLTQTTVGELQTTTDFMFLTGTPDCPRTGNTMQITMTVTNTGTESIDGVSLTESPYVGTSMVCTPMGMDNQIGELVPGESATCIGAYVFTTPDITNGINISLTSTGTASGTGRTKQLVYMFPGETKSDLIGAPDVIYHQSADINQFDSNGYSTWDLTWTRLTPEPVDFGGGGVFLPLTCHDRVWWHRTYGFGSTDPSTGLTLNNFNIHPRHIHGILGIGDITNSGPYIVTTDPIGLQTSWTLYPIQFVGTETWCNITWNPTTGEIAAPCQSRYAFFNMGDMRQYNSIRIATPNYATVLEQVAWFFVERVAVIPPPPP